MAGVEPDGQADALLRERGRAHAAGSWVIAALPLPGGATGFALADGTLCLMDAAGGVQVVEMHQGSCLAAAIDITGGVLSGGDDGRLVAVAPDLGVTCVERFPRKWVEHVAAHPGAKGKGAFRAAATGKEVQLLAPGAQARVLAHPSSVTGLATDTKGKRLAVAHYGGASVWWTGTAGERRALAWKGSHTGIVLSPDGTHVVTAMQENALHGWRLADGADMRMSGYPAKTRSLGFTANGRWLATGGAESVVLWPFFGGGPMGKAPNELMGGDAALCTMVACHPQQEVVAAGWDDGLVAMAEIATERTVPIAAPGRGAVSALAWSADGTRLAFGTEQGFCAVLDLAKR
ncbi:MAG: WD40 repeat domain-containing protein [Acetobacteraceae bacterium]|nr:WD40 repeat domain-containing protein [Acetobacteraceae bacterium]